MKFLTKKQQQEILFHLMVIDDVLDNYPDAKVRCLSQIAEVVSLSLGLPGLIAMRDYSDEKAYKELAIILSEKSERENNENKT